MNNIDRKQHFGELLSDHELWTHTARSLYNAAKLIESEIERTTHLFIEQLDKGNSQFKPEYLELYDSYYLLIGYSFENYFKGIIALRRKEEIMNTVMKSNKRKLVQPKFIHGHKLVKLSNNAGIILNKNEKGLLSGLTEFIEWGGRYHISTHLENELIGTKIYFVSSINRVRNLYLNIALQSGISIISLP